MASVKKPTPIKVQKERKCSSPIEHLWCIISPRFQGSFGKKIHKKFRNQSGRWLEGISALCKYLNSQSLQKSVQKQHMLKLHKIPALQRVYVFSGEGWHKVPPVMEIFLSIGSCWEMKRIFFKVVSCGKCPMLQGKGKQKLTDSTNQGWFLF